MTDPVIHDLDPHAPLPDAPSVVVLRRFAEEDPTRTVVEIVIAAPAGVPRPSAPELDHAPDWDEATPVASRAAAALGLDCVWRIDRTAGVLERAVLSAHGDHTAQGVELDDDDLVDGEPGADMRDVAGPGSRARR